MTFGLTGVLNIFRKQKIDMKGQVVLSFGGLRGGIAFSLMALAGIEDKRLKEVLVIAVISVIGWTVFAVLVSSVPKATQNARAFF